MTPCGLLPCDAEFLNDGVAMFGIDDALHCRVLVFVARHEQKPGRVGAAVEHWMRAAAVEMELSEGVVVAGLPDELPVGTGARNAGKTGEDSGDGCRGPGGDRLDGAPLHRAEGVPEGRADDLVDAAG